jgi:hypothetical protein
MRTFRIVAPLALAGLFALTACGPGSPAPAPTTPSASAAPVDTETPGADDEADAAAASVVVTAESLQVFDTDGVAVFGTLYLDDPASLATQLGLLLGAPTVTSTTGVGSGCDSDQTTYDYGGLLIRTPGYIGSSAPWEVEVTAATTASGLPISTVGGVQIGTEVAAFEAALGDEVLLGDVGNPWYGFDILNPEASEFDHVGTLAQFHAGALTQFNTPYLLYADC